MKFALIPPISLLQASKQCAMDMCIASEVDFDSEDHNKYDYWNYYMLASLNQRFIILDNGVWETGKAVDFKHLLDVLTVIQASEVVVPDVMHDMAATIKMAEEFLSYYDHAMAPESAIRRALGVRPMPQLQFVPQGKDENEWLECYYEMIRRFGHRIDTIGIPKWLGSINTEETAPTTWLNGRQHILRSPEMKFYSAFNYHLLGCNSLREIYMIYANRKIFPSIRSCDTSLPFIAADKHYGRKLHPTVNGAMRELTMRRQPEYFMTPSNAFDQDALERNMKEITIAERESIYWFQQYIKGDRPIDPSKWLTAERLKG